MIFLRRREVTSRVFGNLVLGSVLFSVVIAGMVKTVSSQMRKFAGVTILQGSKEKRVKDCRRPVQNCVTGQQGSRDGCRLRT